MAKKDNKTQGIKLAIRQLGEDGISKKELKQIVETTGADAQTVIQKLDKVNQKLKSNNSPRIGLNSGAANMLIKQESKNPTPVFGQASGFGDGKIGSTLQTMVGTPAYTAPRNPQSGAPAGGSTKGTPTDLMIGGTQIRGGGRVAVRGFGEQYTAPNAKGPYNSENMPITQPTPGVGPGPFAPQQTTETQPVEPVKQDPVVEEPVTPEAMSGGAGMLSGGGRGRAGATKLGRPKSRLRQLGIYGRGAGLLGRGLQYGNALNV